MLVLVEAFKELTKIYGYRPTFHDAVVLEYRYVPDAKRFSMIVQYVDLCDSGTNTDKTVVSAFEITFLGVTGVSGLRSYTDFSRIQVPGGEWQSLLHLLVSRWKRRTCHQLCSD